MSRSAHISIGRPDVDSRSVTRRLDAITAEAAERAARRAATPHLIVGDDESRRRRAPAAADRCGRRSVVS